ncbi:MAG: hypothetical protein Q9M43_07785 [Sulfurimonas sp.]|nr:hypothetical protein [Sulfurimonas sp.]
MELVYLWVEKYKNINNQGFDFSPRFECDYKDAILDIKDKERTKEPYLKNFFCKNINVTAIVGENGSGKSSIIKLIFLLIFIKKYNLEDNPIYDDYIIETIRPFTNKELFLIIFVEDKLKKISMHEFINKLVTKFQDSKDIIIGTRGTTPECQINNYPELTKDELKFFNIHFNYMLDTMYDGVQDKWVKNIYHKADSYETPLLLEPYKDNNDAQQINLDTIEYLNNQNMLRFYSEFDIKNELIDFFEPNKISLNFSTRDFDWFNLNNEDFECLEDCKYFIAYKFFELYHDNNVFLNLREESKKTICEICLTQLHHFPSRNPLNPQI